MRPHIPRIRTLMCCDVCGSSPKGYLPFEITQWLNHECPGVPDEVLETKPGTPVGRKRAATKT